MNVFALFRFSIIAPVALSGIGITYAILAESSFSQDWRDLIAWNGDGGILPDDLATADTSTWIILGVICLAAIISLLNQIFLFFYWKPARTIYLAACIVLYPAMLLFGLSILTPVEYFLCEISSFLSGITLALAYYSPVAERFK